MQLFVCLEKKLQKSPFVQRDDVPNALTVCPNNFGTHCIMGVRVQNTTLVLKDLLCKKDDFLI